MLRAMHWMQKMLKMMLRKSADNGFLGKDGFIMALKEVPNMESTAVDRELQNIWEFLSFKYYKIFESSYVLVHIE